MGNLEWTANRASQAMIDALEGDSRLVILFDANSEGNYVGVDTRTDYATQVALFERPNNENYYCSYDTATFSRNRDMPGIIISAAEVALYKASAINKGYASGDAKEAFVKRHGFFNRILLRYQFDSYIPSPYASSRGRRCYRLCRKQMGDRFKQRRSYRDTNLVELWFPSNYPSLVRN